MTLSHSSVSSSIIQLRQDNLELQSRNDQLENALTRISELNERYVNALGEIAANTTDIKARLAAFEAMWTPTLNDTSWDDSDEQ